MEAKKDPTVKKARNTIEMKKEIIEKYESGIKIAEIGRMYGKSRSTISSIVAKKEAIKEADVAKGVNMITKQRSQAVEYAEQLLLIWINQKQSDGYSMTEVSIREKALQLYEDIVKEMPVTSASVDREFKASRGWFEKFKRRTGILGNSRRSSGGAGLVKSGKEQFVSEFDVDCFIASEGCAEFEGLNPEVDNCGTELVFHQPSSPSTIRQEGQSCQVKCPFVLCSSVIFKNDVPSRQTREKNQYL